MNKFKFDNKLIILIGDIHGHFRPLLFEIKKKSIKNALFIQIGDFGMGFHKDGYYLTELVRINTKLKEKNNTLIVVRGNHDDPKYFNGDFKYSNLKLVPDYSTLETYIGNILCIGGAASIDKQYRIEDKTWWKGELHVYDLDKLKELENANIEHIVAHSNPKFCHPLNKNHSFGQEVNEYLDISRNILSNIYTYMSNFNNIKNWYNGHYHWYSDQLIEGTRFVTLPIMEFKELK